MVAPLSWGFRGWILVPGADRGQGPELICVVQATGPAPSRFKIARVFEFIPLNCAPAGFEPALTAPEAVSRYRTDQRKRCRRCPGRARIGRSPPTPRSAGLRPAFVARCVIDTRASVRRAAPPSIWAATWSRRWPSGAALNGVVYAQLRRPTAHRRSVADERTTVPVDTAEGGQVVRLAHLLRLNPPDGRSSHIEWQPEGHRRL